MAITGSELYRLKYPNVNIDRSAAVTGYDIAFQADGDLLYSRGDLALSSGVALITEALVRRLSTPPGGYSRYALTSEGVAFLDGTYDSQVYLRLSAPLTRGLVEQITTDVQAAAQQESRIQGLTVETEFLVNSVFLDFKYRILSDPELLQLRANLSTV